MHGVREGAQLSLSGQTYTVTTQVLAQQLCDATMEPRRAGLAWGSVFTTTGVLTAERLLGVQWVLHADANDVAGQVLVCVDKLGLPISGGILRRLAFSVARGKDVSSLQT